MNWVIQRLIQTIKSIYGFLTQILIESTETDMFKTDFHNNNLYFK